MTVRDKRSDSIVQNATVHPSPVTGRPGYLGTNSWGGKSFVPKEHAEIVPDKPDHLDLIRRMGYVLRNGQDCTKCKSAGDGCGSPCGADFDLADEADAVTGRAG